MGKEFLGILAGHLVGLLVFRRFTASEVNVNAEMIKRDGANNTLGHGFHSRRTWIRFWWWLGCTVGGSIGALLMPWPAQAWSLAALGVLLGGYFLRTFSPMLNAALGLSYKPRFYVSYSSTASALDRSVLWLASKVYGDWKTTPQYQAARAALLFQTMLNVCLVLTLLVYVALLLPLLM